MAIRWKKLGRLYTPQALHPKLATHAANPLPVHLQGDVYRIYFSGRDEQNRSSVGFVEADIVKMKIVHIHRSPVFEHGEEGTFFSHGVSIGNIYEVERIHYMLFMGWQCPKNAHWRGDIGRLIVEPNGSLHLDSSQPFLSVDAVDPISLSYPFVLKNQGGYRMWYGSTLDWASPNGEMVHVIHQAHSEDGHAWVREGLAVPYELNRAQAFSRPSVWGSESEGYDMWFSFRSGRGEAYRIGYAHSRDGVEWKLRLEDCGIDVSDSGWDSEMIEYPYVFAHHGKKYMLYNGNGHGRSGFGLAMAE